MSAQTSRPMPAPRPARRAFTVAELVVVMSIIVILSTVAVVGYGSLRTADELDASARRVQSTLHRARTLAINSGQPHEFAIDLDQHAFWVDNVDATTPRPKVDGLAFLTEHARFARVRIGGHPPVESGEVRIPFAPDGRSPFAVIQVLRAGADDADPANYHTIRLFPHGEARIERTRVD